MRFQATVLAFAATLAFTGAQDLSQVPQCAIPCFVAALPASKCGSTDIKCQCTTGRDPLQASLMACVPTKCSQEDALKIIPAVSGLCAAAGVSLSDIPTAASTAAGTAAATSAGSSASATVSGSPAASGSASGSSASATSSRAAQSTGAASGNAAAIGAVALGLAAAIGL